MIEILTLTAAAVFVRASGAAVRRPTHVAWLRLGGWIVCASGIWLLAGAAGAWFPIWPVLLVGVFAGCLHLVVKRDQPIMAATDAGVVLMAGALSTPALEVEVLLGAAVFAVVVGLLADQLPRVMPRGVRLAAFSVPAVLGMLGVIAFDRLAAGGDAGAWHRLSPFALFNAGVSRSINAQRIELPTGAVAWLDRPRYTDDRRLPGAVVFHGNHRDASHQPAACVLRRALLEAGYVVLSLDHIGYGETPLPNVLPDADAWDPSPHVFAAIDRLRAEPGVGAVTAIGHSMGCLDVLRTLAHDEPPDAAIVFGMGVYDPPPSDERWVRGFLSSRHLPRDAIDHETGAAIRARYYEMENLLNANGARRTPLIFVRFGLEHQDLVIGRERALALLHEPLILQDMPRSTHYFSASERFGIVFGDVRVTRDLAQRLKSFQCANLAHREFDL